jgi:hypothetical protein
MTAVMSKICPPQGVVKRFDGHEYLDEIDGISQSDADSISPVDQVQNPTSIPGELVSAQGNSHQSPWHPERTPAD